VTYTLDRHRLAAAFKALSNPTRLLAVNSLAAGPASQKQLQAQLALGGRFVPQGTLAHHLHVLRDAGLISQRNQSVWVVYDLDREMFRAMASMIRPGGRR